MFYIITHEGIVYHVFEQIKNLNTKMNVVDYGWYDYKHKKVITPDDREFEIKGYFENNCKILQPKEVWKYKIGTCWDQALLAYYELSKLNIECTYYFLCDKKVSITHTFIMFKYDDKFYWFEHAYELFRGISGPWNAEDEVIDHVVKVFINDNEEIFKNEKPIIKKVNADKLLNINPLTCKIFLNICGVVV